MTQHNYMCMYLFIFDKPRGREGEEKNIHTRRRLSFMRVAVFRFTCAFFDRLVGLCVCVFSRYGMIIYREDFWIELV